MKSFISTNINIILYNAVKDVFLIFLIFYFQVIVSSIWLKKNSTNKHVCCVLYINAHNSNVCMDSVFTNLLYNLINTKRSQHERIIFTFFQVSILEN